MVGNDIVDLHFCESPAQHHVRHLRRVCARTEADVVMASPDPCRCLAMLWASKEAAYKLFARTEGMVCKFVPRQFVLDVRELGEAKRVLWSKVVHEGREARVEINVTGRSVHAIATFSDCGLVRSSVQEIEKRFLDWRQARIESDAVRQLANDLLSECGEQGVSLEFAGRMPILKGQAGGQARMGVSLSHHGAFVGAAIAWPLAEAFVEKRLGGRLSEVSSWGTMCSSSTV